MKTEEETILSIMKMLNMPETQAMKVAGIPEEEYEKYSDLIKQ